MKRQIAAFVLIFCSSWSFAFSPVCYIPGVGGAKGFALDKLPAEMKKREIPFELFQTPQGKAVVDIAPSLCDHFLKLREENPNFKCHVFGYSMGGVLSRYAFHHLQCAQKKTKQKIPFAEMFLSLTTAASPHKGTPLATWLAKQFPNGRPEMLDMGEEQVKKFNEPEYENTYSPEPRVIPAFSIRSYITEKSQAISWAEYLGFDLLTQKLKDQNQIDEGVLSDGVVPFLSQGFGEIVKDLNVPHGFFGSHGFDKNKLSFANFLEEYYKNLP